jgi:hypothetical protein
MPGLAFRIVSRPSWAMLVLLGTNFNVPRTNLVVIVAVLGAAWLADPSLGPAEAIPTALRSAVPQAATNSSARREVPPKKCLPKPIPLSARAALVARLTAAL